MTQRQSIGIAAGIVAVAVIAFRLLHHGWPAHEGNLRQTARLEVHDVRRGTPGTVTVTALAHYTPRDSDDVRTVAVPKLEALAIALVDAKHIATPLAAEWHQHDGEATAEVTLAEVPDGDYTLHVSFESALGKGELDAPIPLYTPALVHVITDRPLYEPGNLVRFRAVVLRARDLFPLDQRPGKWVITDPEGEVLLEEKAPAGDWGVVAGTFPLDKLAQVGTWHVAWSSGGATDDVPFRVEPFTLPRFRVEAAAQKPFYRPNDAPVISGSVLYSSGAPVGAARLDIEWNVSGAWPPPTEWLTTLLPKTAVAGANGRFELALPRIPPDLQGQATITARIAATDPAGDRVESSASVLLSEDGIVASSVTELGNGLVAGFNNRLYVRVATPDGRVVANQKVTIRRAWQPSAPTVEADLDEDGVASLQVDPGAPVNIVIPALPYRPPPPQPQVTRGEVREIVANEGASLADQLALDHWLPALASCTKWSAGGTTLTVGVHVDAGGGIAMVTGDGSALDRCVAGVIRQQRLPAGAVRMYALQFGFHDQDLGNVSTRVDAATALPEGFGDAVQMLAHGARDCLPPDASGALGKALAWRARAGSKDIELTTWVDDGVDKLAALACVTAHVSGRITLAKPVDTDAFGLVRFTVSAAARAGESRPQATTLLGYELAVSTAIAGAGASTKLRVEPGEVPNLRLRVTPVLARPGDTITAELIRGPRFATSGQMLPKNLSLAWLKGTSIERPLDAAHKATFTLEPATEGWVAITGGGVRALVYVRPAADLAVTVTPEHDRYAPGQMAQLKIATLLGGHGGKAAVGLFGVDESLGQLVTLPGPGELGRILPKVGTTAPAFGSLDGQALTLGRIRGVNAAAATVLRVSTIPDAPQLDAVVSARAETHFDPIEELTDHFYIVLAELAIQAHRWELEAPAAERMKPATMAALWNTALAACEKRGEPVDDAYGRKLRLSRLPPDLLALTDPSVVIVMGTRLTEDVDNWAAWVAKEKP